MSLRGGGTKRDNMETVARNFQDEDSFVGLDGHEYLRGEDWKQRQSQVYIRYKGKCQKCGYDDTVDGMPFDIHHILHRSKGGSDDLDNLILVCRRCHNTEHREREPRWTPKS